MKIDRWWVTVCYSIFTYVDGRLAFIDDLEVVFLFNLNLFPNKMLVWFKKLSITLPNLRRCVWNFIFNGLHHDGSSLSWAQLNVKKKTCCSLSCLVFLPTLYLRKMCITLFAYDDSCLELLTIIYKCNPFLFHDYGNVYFSFLRELQPYP